MYDFVSIACGFLQVSHRARKFAQPKCAQTPTDHAHFEQQHGRQGLPAEVQEVQVGNDSDKVSCRAGDGTGAPSPSPRSGPASPRDTRPTAEDSECTLPQQGGADDRGVQISSTLACPPAPTTAAGAGAIHNHLITEKSASPDHLISEKTHQGVELDAEAPPEHGDGLLGGQSLASLSSDETHETNSSDTPTGNCEGSDGAASDLSAASEAFEVDAPCSGAAPELCEKDATGVDAGDAHRAQELHHPGP